MYDLNQLHCIVSELPLTYTSKILGRDGEMGRDGETGRKKLLWIFILTFNKAKI